MAKEIRVEFKVRNNLILTKMEGRGIPNLAELAKQMSSRTPGNLYKLVSMKIPARNLDGSWRKTAIDLSDFFQCMPEDLFSDEQQMIALETNRATAEMDFAEIQLLTSGVAARTRPDLLAEASELRQVINSVLTSLNTREQRILSLHFGLNGENEHSVSEISDMFSLTDMSIRIIMAKALRKLKHPSRAHLLLSAVGKVRKDWRRDHSDAFDGDMLEAMHNV